MLARAQDKARVWREGGLTWRGTRRRNPQEFIVFQSHGHICSTEGFIKLQAFWINLHLPLCPETINIQSTESFLKFIITITERARQRFQVPNPTKDWAGAGFRIPVVHPNSPQNKRIQKAVHTAISKHSHSNLCIHVHLRSSRPVPSGGV